MATITEGFLGGFSGKLGPVVGYQWRGRWCLRGKPEWVRNPRTEAQQRHRAMFREEVRLAARMNRVLKQSLATPSLEAMMTPCNYFVHLNQRAFGWTAAEGASDEGSLTVGWSLLTLSEGPVAPVAFGTPVVTGRTCLKIDFEKNPLHVRADSHDYVYLYVYCPAIGGGYLAAPVYRSAQEINVLLPSLMAGKEVHLWGLVEDGQGR